MSFIEENKNFLQNFYSELRNLDLDSKQQKYENFKDQIKNRTSLYYQKIEIDEKTQTLLQKDRFYKDLIDCIRHYNADESQTLLQKDRFYKDLIDCIGEYDFDYILMNLFLDKDFLKLILSFYKNEKFKSLLEQSKTSLGFFIKGFNKKLNDSLAFDKEFSTYLKNAFYDFIPTDNNTWEEKGYKTKSSINHKYAQYVIQSITLDSPCWHMIIYNHMLFIKAYNHLGYFSIDKSLKSILFINELIDQYNLEKQQKDVKLVELVTKIEDEIHSNCFVDYIKSPICISESTAHNISTGLANRIKEFDDLLDIRNVIAKTDESSYYDLFKLSDRISIQDLNAYLNKKIITGVFISSEEIRRIEDDSNFITIKAKQLILKKFYLFESLEFKN